MNLGMTSFMSHHQTMDAGISERPLKAAMGTSMVGSLVAVRHPDLGPCREECSGSDQLRHGIMFVDYAASQPVRNPVNKTAGPFFLFYFIVLLAFEPSR